MEQLVKLTSENPARIWGLYPEKGALASGSDADIAIVDLHQEWKLSVNNLNLDFPLSFPPPSGNPGTVR